MSFAPEITVRCFSTERCLTSAVTPLGAYGETRKMMSRAILIGLASAALVASATPSMAHSAYKRHHHYYGTYGTDAGPSYRYRSYGYADPSFGYYPTLRNFQRRGRCVEDLGYGNFELCN